MNLKKILEDVDKDVSLSADDIAERVAQEGLKLKEAIFKIQPEDCFLRGWKALTPGMYIILSPEMIERNLIDPKDICAMCPAEDCPHNEVSFRRTRISKVMLLSKFYNK